MVYVDSIARGRVWTGTRGKEIGLVDRIGTLQDAVVSAAKMADVKEYKLKNIQKEKPCWNR